ncbi:MAG: hypothetical protein NZM31_06070 [Gemmatales bacterium]|nr:hypothetical protein [Gemmatales bacterium]MDW8386565.1 hypothetical protein [Gemmatales bacterium]
MSRTQRSGVTVRAITAMAPDRKTFKNRLQDILGAALTHFYMVQLAQRNRQTKWVQHWNTEIDRLIHMDLVRILVSAINGGRWDKRKALAESLQDVQAADQGYRKVAANYIAKVYRLRKIEARLPQGMERSFYAAVQEAAEFAVQPDHMADDS